jgi:hypothetical protein
MVIAMIATRGHRVADGSDFEEARNETPLPYHSRSLGDGESDVRVVFAGLLMRTRV